MARVSQDAAIQIRERVVRWAERWRLRRAFNVGESLNETEAKLREWFQRAHADGVPLDRAEEVLCARVESIPSGMYMYTRELLQGLTPTKADVAEMRIVMEDAQVEFSHTELMEQTEPLWDALRRNDPESGRRCWDALAPEVQQWIRGNAGPRATRWLARWGLIAAMESDS